MKHPLKRFAAMRAALAVVLTLCMLLGMLLPAYATDSPVYFDDCDDKAGWSGVKGVDEEEMTEGKGSIYWVIPSRGGFHVTRKLDEPVDASGKTYMEFDLYVSDADTFYTMGEHQFEVTSSGGSDVEEFTFYLNRMQIEDGWNHISLMIGGGCDFSRVNFIRIYALSHSGSASYTMRIDNIRFVNREALPEDERVQTAVPVIKRALTWNTSTS